jgi:hypothetical protein
VPLLLLLLLLIQMENGTGASCVRLQFISEDKKQPSWLLFGDSVMSHHILVDRAAFNFVS